MSLTKKIPVNNINIIGEYPISVHGIEVDTVEYFQVPEGACIKKLSHNDQWEVWTTEFLDTTKRCKEAYIYLKGEEHCLINFSKAEISIVAYKGSTPYTYEELAGFWKAMGFITKRGSLIN